MSARRTAFLTVGAVALLGFVVAVPGCKNKDDDKKSTKNKVTDAKAKNPPAGQKKKARPKPRNVRPKPDEDYIIAEARHTKPKPHDPVTVNFRGFKVIKAKFDPNKIVGGTAEIEIDLTSLDSGISKRNRHLKSDDYFGVGNFGKATIKIKDVKKLGDKKYSAKAEIFLHNVRVTQPIQFEVVSVAGDTIRIKVEHTINRVDFKIGGASAAGDSAADQVVIKAQLTLKNSP